MVNKIILNQNQSTGEICEVSIESKDEKIRTEPIVPGTYTLEEAIKLTGHGKFHFYLLIISGCSIMGVVAENTNIGFVMPYLRCDMHLTFAEQGLMSSVGYIGILIASHFWGFLADTWGRHKVLRAASLGSFLCAVLSSFSVNPLMLYVTRFTVGAFVAGAQATVYSYIGEFHSNLTRTRASAFVAMFMPACFVFLPILAYFIIPMQWHWFVFGIKITPWRLYLLFSSFLNGFNFVGLSFFPETPKFMLSMNKKTEALQVLKRMYSINTGNQQETFPVKDLYSEEKGTNISEANGVIDILKLFWNQTWPLFVTPHFWNTITLCYLMFVLFSIGHGTFMWFPDFLTQLQDEINTPMTLCQGLAKNRNNTITEMLNATEEEVCDVDNTNTLSIQIIFMMGVVFVAISAVVSFFIEKVDRKLLLTLWLLLTSIVGVLMVFVQQFYVMVVCFILFLSCGLCAGIISAISVALYPTNYRAMATCIILNFGRAGAVAGSNFVGILLENNCELIFYVYSALILSCVVICFFFNTNPGQPNKVADKIKESS